MKNQITKNHHNVKKSRSNIYEQQDERRARSANTTRSSQNFLFVVFLFCVVFFFLAYVTRRDEIRRLPKKVSSELKPFEY